MAKKKKKAAKRASKRAPGRGQRIQTKALAQAILRELKVAQRVVSQGDRALAKAQKSGRTAAAAKNQQMLVRANRVLAALEAAMDIAHPRRAASRALSISGDECPFGGLGPQPFTWE